MLSLDNAEVYDIEVFPNLFTLHMEMLNSDVSATWEISHFRDDRASLMQHFQYLAQNQIFMIGFNNIGYDYQIIHFIFHNPQCTVEQIYAKNESIINSQDRFGGGQMLWPSDRFAPQIDLFKIYHMDNHAKSTTLKALQINMRSESVVESSVPFGVPVTFEQIEKDVIPYNKHDVKETKRFAHFSMEAIKFRMSLIDDFGVDVLNWADTKIGSKIMEKRLGDDLCYIPAYRDEQNNYHKKQTRQTPRHRVALADVIFPYVRFERPEFNAVLDYLRQQVLTTDQLKEFGGEGKAKLQTKGVFTDLTAFVGGIKFAFGTGGIHGSVERQRVMSGNGWLIRDIDVASLYPSIGIVNRLAPEHLGERFVEVYSGLPIERKRWQKEKGKKCVEANTLKLASNGVYGNSNSPFSVFYDPKYTMSITINGQLLLCMLAEQLLKVPTLSIIQINTDGITYFVRNEHQPYAKEICKWWENLTALTLEDANYKRMFIRDVNNYIAEDLDGNLKLKGAYWTPDPLDYHASISNAQPPAWHKDLGNLVSIRAAVAAMVHGVPPETFIRMCTNPFDFMCRIKVKKSDTLLHGGQPIQKTSRYFVSVDGAQMVKVAPADGVPGMFKRANKISEFEYQRVMAETGGKWDARVCTKNQSVYEEKETAIQAGYRVSLCNNVSEFSFDKVNYEWYVNEAEKLII